MALVTLELSDEDHLSLQEEYRQMAVSWPRPGRTGPPPSFEQWLGARVAGHSDPQAADTGRDDIRAFAAIEKLVISLQQHGFGLAHLGRHDATIAESADALAELLVRELRMTMLQKKRIEEVIGYYAKTAKEIADSGRVGVTNRAYGALHEAYRELVERTGDALTRLGEQRSIGRVEGAVAILVSLQVMERQSARQKTEAFKARVRNPGRQSE